MVLENKLASSEGVRQPLFRSASEITGICVVIITTLYLALVYLLFFKFKLLPWQGIAGTGCTDRHHHTDRFSGWASGTDAFQRSGDDYG